MRVRTRLECVACTKMASARVPHKLHLVKLVRSRIGKPWWERRTLRALGLRKRNEVKIHKNTPRVNGQIETVKRLVKVTPVYFTEEGLEEAVENFETVNVEDLKYENLEKPCEQFLDSSGHFRMKDFLEYHKNVVSKLEKDKVDKQSEKEG